MLYLPLQDVRTVHLAGENGLTVALALHTVVPYSVSCTRLPAGGYFSRFLLLSLLSFWTSASELPSAEDILTFPVSEYVGVLIVDCVTTLPESPLRFWLVGRFEKPTSSRGLRLRFFPPPLGREWWQAHCDTHGSS